MGTTRRKLKLLQCKTCYIVIGVVIVIWYIFLYRNLPGGSSIEQKQELRSVNLNQSLNNRSPLTKENLPYRITIIIREFQDFDHELLKTLKLIEKELGAIKVFIVADNIPYPPVKLEKASFARIIPLSCDLFQNYTCGCPLHFITTEYVLFLPDASVFKDWKIFKVAVSYLRSRRQIDALAIGVGDRKLTCSPLEVDMKRWTVSFMPSNSSSKSSCSFIREPHALFLLTKTLKSLAEPFAKPFPFTFYVQSRLKKLNIQILPSMKLNSLRTLYSDPQSNWKHKQMKAEQTRSFYKKVGIRQEILSPGLSNYFGCSKNTPRCFDTIVNDMPEYLYQGRWTPPCCLKALRETSAYVFRILDQCNVRYWLEGGTLLGAARTGDIIPWDYDVDIGIYYEDIQKCSYLHDAKTSRFIDEKDFLWEKAIEGDFIRVQYSESNHLHVDLHPFYSRNGTMTKSYWFPTHRQDTEFPESFLKPLTRIQFAGINASAPNNVRKFLEFKFGPGVIENPRYPNYQRPVL